MTKHPALPHRRPSRLSRRLAAACAGGLLVASGNALAIGLGEIRIQSSLHAPLQAEIPLLGVSPDQIDRVRIRLGRREEFADVGVDYLPEFDRVAVDVVRRANGVFVQLRSQAVMREPLLQLVLVADDAGVRVLREYVLMLDPPQSRIADAAPAPSVTTAPADAATPVTAGAAVPVRQASAVTTGVVTTGPEPVVAGATPAADGWQYGPTRRGDSLSKIAQRLDRDGNWRRYASALLSANPQAFINNDPHRLKAGVLLTLPDASVLARAGELPLGRAPVLAGADHAPAASEPFAANQTAANQSPANQSTANQTTANRAASSQPAANRADTGAAPANANVSLAGNAAPSAPVSAQRPPASVATPTPAAVAVSRAVGSDAAADQLQLAQQLNQQLRDELAAAARRVADLESRLAQIDQRMIDIARRDVAALQAGATTAGAAVPAGTPNVPATDAPPAAAESMPAAAASTASVSQAENAHPAAGSTSGTVAAAAPAEQAENAGPGGRVLYLSLAAGAFVLAMLMLFWRWRSEKEKELARLRERVRHPRTLKESLPLPQAEEKLIGAKSAAAATPPDRRAMRVQQVRAAVDTYLAYNRPDRASELLQQELHHAGDDLLLRRELQLILKSVDEAAQARAAAVQAEAAADLEKALGAGVERSEKHHSKPVSPRKNKTP